MAHIVARNTGPGQAGRGSILQTFPRPTNEFPLQLAALPILSSRFIRNIQQLFLASSASQMIVILSVPFLSRSLPPEEFGRYAVFSAFLSILAAVGTLKLDAAIIVPMRDAQAKRLVRLCLLWSLGFSVFSALCVAALREYRGVHWSWILMPPTIFFLGVVACSRQYAARKLQYSAVSLLQICHSIVYISIALLLANAARAPDAALVAAYFSATLVCAAFHLILLRNELDIRWPRRIFSLVRRYLDFPRYVLPLALLGLSTQSVMIFLLTSHFTLAEVGLFAVASRLMQAPSTFIGAAIAEAFRSELAVRLRTRAATKNFYYLSIARLLMLTVGVYAIAAVLAPSLFRAFLGPEYSAAGMLARYMSAGVAANFMANFLQSVPVITGNARFGLVLQAGVVGLNLVPVIIGLSFDLELIDILGIWSASVLLALFLQIFGCSVCMERVDIRRIDGRPRRAR